VFQSTFDRALQYLKLSLQPGMDLWEDGKIIGWTLSVKIENELTTAAGFSRPDFSARCKPVARP
jgi:hypothetical protein